MTPTRYDTKGAELFYEKVDRNLWRIFAKDDDGTFHAYGPQYKTKAELLADLHRYARACWGY